MNMSTYALSPEDLGRVSESRRPRLEQVNTLARQLKKPLLPAMVVFLRTVDDETFDLICPTDRQSFLGLWFLAEKAASALSMLRETPILDAETDCMRAYLKYMPDTTMLPPRSPAQSSPSLPSAHQTPTATTPQGTKRRRGSQRASPRPSASTTSTPKASPRISPVKQATDAITNIEAIKALDPSYHRAVKPKLDKRDGQTCLITKNFQCEAAHIYSRSLIPKGPTDRILPETGLCGSHLWDWMRCLMPEEEYQKCVAEWKRLVSGEMHPLENYLNLAHDIQMAWTDGLFALKVVHVSTDKKKMVLQLVFSGGDYIRLDTPLDALADFNNTDGVDCVKATSGDGIFRLYNYSRNTMYKNGDLVEIVTHDPLTHPLPSPTLLRMKYLYTRFLSLLARGLDEDLEDDDSDADVDALSLASVAEEPPVS